MYERYRGGRYVNRCDRCVHYGYDVDEAYCSHPESLLLSAFGRSTTWMRRVGKPCGPEGVLFEQHPPIITKGSSDEELVD
jgi:hypothetical protein